MISLDLILGTLVALSAAFVIGHIYNVIKFRDSAKAAKETMSSFPALSLGAATAGLVVVTDLVFILVGGVLAAPDVLITGLLGLLGYLTLDGVISLTPETWGLLTIVAGVTLAVVR